MKRSRIPWFLMTVILLGILVAGCAAETSSGSARPDTPPQKVKHRIKPLVEKLYLDAKALEQAYLDVRTAAHVQAFKPDDLQLSYLQKIALYLEKAQLTVHHQWRFFSIMEDIRTDALRDYYTLGHQGLVKAADETVYTVQFIRLYLNFVESAEAKKDIRKSLDLIDGIQTRYTQLIDAVAPLVHQGQPTSI